MVCSSADSATSDHFGCTFQLCGLLRSPQLSPVEAFFKEHMKAVAPKAVPVTVAFLNLKPDRRHGKIPPVGKLELSMFWGSSSEDAQEKTHQSLWKDGHQVLFSKTLFKWNTNKVLGKSLLTDIDEVVETFPNVVTTAKSFNREQFKTELCDVSNDASYVNSVIQALRPQSGDSWFTFDTQPLKDAVTGTRKKKGDEVKKRVKTLLERNEDQRNCFSDAMISIDRFMASHEVITIELIGAGGDGTGLLYEQDKLVATATTTYSELCKHAKKTHFQKPELSSTSSPAPQESPEAIQEAPKTLPGKDTVTLKLTDARTGKSWGDLEVKLQHSRDWTSEAAPLSVSPAASLAPAPDDTRKEKLKRSNAARWTSRAAQSEPLAAQSGGLLAVSDDHCKECCYEEVDNHPGAVVFLGAPLTLTFRVPQVKPSRDRPWIALLLIQGSNGLTCRVLDQKKLSQSQDFEETIPDSWTITDRVFPPGEEQSERNVFFALSSGELPAGPLDATTPLGQVKVVGKSNIFLLKKAQLLTEVELAYAAFVKQHRLEMDPLDDGDLERVGVSVEEMRLRVLENVRRKFEFEDGNAFSYTPGQCCVANGPLTVASTRQRKFMVQPQVRKKRVITQFLLRQDAYIWISGPGEFLYRKQVQYTPELISAIKSFLRNSGIAPLVLFTTSAFKEVGKATRADWLTRTADGFNYVLFEVLDVAEKIALPFVETALFVVQFVFACLPAAFVVAAVVLQNYYQHSISPGFHISISGGYLSDFFLAPSQWEFAVNEVPATTQVIMMISAAYTLLMIPAAARLNFGSEATPGLRSLSTMMNVVFGIYGMTLVWFVLVTMLWFVLGCLVNPDALLPYAVMITSGAGVAGGLWKATPETFSMPSNKIVWAPHCTTAVMFFCSRSWRACERCWRTEPDVANALPWIESENQEP